jgi:5-bromo-4-chloroindolyl phosphate hydrolysis protein
MIDEEYLAELIVARSKALQAQSYSIKDRAATRANLTEINNEIRRIERKIARTTNGGIRVRGVTPVG